MDGGRFVTLFGGAGRDLLRLFRGGESGFLFYPMSDLSKLFQDSAGTTPVAADTDPVGLAKDRSGGGNDASQATTTKRPLWKANSGKPYLLFDGTDDYLDTPFLPQAATTLAVACNVSSSAGGQTLVGSQVGAQRCDLQISGTTGFATFAWAGDGNTAGGQDAVDHRSADTILLLTGDTVSRDFWVNGALAITGAPNGGLNGTGGHMYLGADNNGAAHVFTNGRIYAALAMNRRVTPAEIAMITSQFRGSFQ